MDHTTLMREQFASAAGPAEALTLTDETAAVEYRLREIDPFWRVFDCFVFDFSGIDRITTGFAQGLFGALAERHGEWVNDKFRFLHVPDHAAVTLKLVLEENLRHYRFQPKA